MRNFNLKNLALSAVFAALIFVATAFLPKIPIPGTGGYAHIGDAFIYIAAALLPAFYSASSAAVGATLADVILGYAAYSPFTFFIKAFMALCISSKSGKTLSIRNVIGTVLAGVINIGGYYVAEGIITGNAVSPIASIPFNVMQSGASLLLFLIIAFAIDKAKLKDRLGHM